MATQPPDRKPVAKLAEDMPMALRWVVIPYAGISALWILISDRLVDALFTDPSLATVVMTVKGWGFVAVTSVLLAVLLRRYLGALAKRDAALGDAEHDKLKALLLLEALTDSSPDAVFAKDKDGHYLLFNRGASAITGKRAEEVLGRTDQELFPPKIYAEWVRHDEYVLAANSVVTDEQTLPDARGLRTLLVTKGPLRDRDGAMRGLFGIARDISARKAVEDELRESQLRFATFFRSSPIGIGISHFDDGPFTEVNAAFLDIFGYTQEEVIGRTSLELQMWPVIEERKHMYRHLAEHGRVMNREVTCRRKTGELLDLLVSGELLELGGCRYFMGMLIDITERKRAETILRDSARALKSVEESLIRSQAQLKSLVRYAPMGVAMFDRDMNYLATSDRWLVGHGQAGKNLIGRNHYEVHGDLPEKWKQVHRHALAGTATSEDEDLWIRADGERHWLRWTALPWLDEDGTIGGIIISSEDVTDSILAQRQLRQLSLAVEQSPESIVITDLAGDIEYVNAAFVAQTGYGKAEAIGRNSRFLQSGKTPPETYAALWKTLGEDRTWSGEFQNRRKDGSEYTEFASISPIHQADGEMTHYLAIKADITAQKRTEQAIQASKQLLQRVIDSTPDWIHVKDKQHRFMLVNQSFAESLGLTPEEMVGRPDEESLRRHVGEDLDRQIARIRQLDDLVLSGETVHSERDEIVFPDGKLHIFDMFKGPLRDAANEIYGVLTVRRDITQRRRNEQEQLALEEQLRQAQKMEMIGHLTAGIAHDFNNILTAIFGFAELAQMSPATARDALLPRYLLRIIEAAARARDLVAQLLTFSHKRGQSDEWSEILPIIKEVRKLLRSTIPATIAIRKTVADGLPPALISSIQLHQILMNLGVNAGDAIGEKGSIEIRANQVHLTPSTLCASCHRPFWGDYLMIAVADTGTGIPQADLAKIFDPFFSTKEVGRGSGLGLSVLHGIVHSANGHVEVTTELGKGSEFRVFLPIKPSSLGPPALDTGPKALSVRVAGHVLLIDDEAGILEFMTGLLESIGCTVAAYSDSLEAWRRFRDAPDEVDLVITDQTMPNMTGAELTRAILAVRPELPILLSTGYSTALDERAAREAGARRLLRKPVPSRVLCELVAQYLPQVPNDESR
jgi:nitrogen fixation negative regulator NifL